MNIETVLQVGIDWADKKHDYCIYNVKSRTYTKGIVLSNAKSVIDWISNLRKHNNNGIFEICLETSNGPIIEILNQFDFIRIYPINPSCSNNYRKSCYPSMKKDDPTDSKLILNYLMCQKRLLRELNKADENTRLIEELCKDRRDLVNRKTQLILVLISNLKLYYPESIELAGDLSSTMAQDFFKRWPDLETLSHSKANTLISFYHNHYSRSNELIESRLELLKNSKSTTNSKAMLMACKMKTETLLAEIKLLSEHIKRYDKMINESMKNDNDSIIFHSFPGAANVLAPRLMAAFKSSFINCKTATEMSVYSGVAPIKRQTGNSKRVYKRLMRPIFLHQTLFEFAESSKNHSKWANAFYNYHIKVLHESTNSVIRKLAVKWLRIIHKCYSSGACYDENLYIENLKKKGCIYM